MAYKISSTCGGLRYSTSDFTEIDNVITEESMLIDVYEPIYSTGVSADFDANKYSYTYAEEDTTFTATVADTVISWSDGVRTGLDAEDMADVGLSNIVGVVDGSTIKIEYSEESVPRTELVGEPFIANMCGGIKFDDGVFSQVGNVVTLAGVTSVANSFKANCSLLFDASKFELGDDKEICLK